MASGRFRKLEREGSLRLEDEPLPPEAMQKEAERAFVGIAEPPMAAPDAAPPGLDPLPPPSEHDEPGFGTVLASGVLVACIMALVSIPVRRIFGASGSQGSDGELVTLVVLTLLIYALVRRRLRRL